MMVNGIQLRAPLSGGDEDVGPSVELFSYRSNAGAGTAPILSHSSAAKPRQDAPVHLLPKMCQSWCKGQLLVAGGSEIKVFLFPHLKELHEITVAALAQFCTD